MKGDFSQWGLDPTDNFSGVLHQQGRVLLDQDWNGAEQIDRLWRETAAADVIGTGIAAVPAAQSDSLKVTQADVSAEGVDITLQPGRLWADGVHLHYTGVTPITAEYLGPPLQSPQASVETIANGVRDAVILEVRDEAFSAFQDPLHLLEPALGGPDTTERVRTAMALKLWRLDADEDCGNLALADDFDAKGRLTVTPSPTEIVAGPCPVPESGGYSGFEHYLYRVEITTPEAGQARFKWSQYNGGLVGRGAFTPTDATSGDVAVTANNQMINQCGLDTFYLEALDFDAALGHWRVVLSADATLPSDDNLSLTNLSGTWPAGTTGFFRLWNGIDLISNFPTGLALANELEVGIGIRLAFDAPLADLGNYTPGDFWTIPARTAGVDFDPSVWPTDAVPQGVHYHRAPLAIITWSGQEPVTASAAAGEIHDCRHVFQPLAKLQTCCTVKVGDGLSSFGDFTSIQDAINALPAAGGEVCILPGLYIEDIHIDNRQNIRLHGCGPRTRIQSSAKEEVLNPPPVIRIIGSDNIRIDSLAVFAHLNGVGIHVEAKLVCENLVFHNLRISAATRSGIQIDAGQFITLNDSTVVMRDVPSPWPAVFLKAEDVLVEDNVLRVQRSRDQNPDDVGRPAETRPTGTGPRTVAAGRGGLQIAGTSERIRVIDNLIDGGIGNGITLGSIEEISVVGGPSGIIGWVINANDPCDPCAPGDGHLPPRRPGDGTPEYQSVGPLYDILIEHNRIYNMGLNGIGVVAFFSLAEVDEFISVENLTIDHNEIRYCLWRPLAVIEPEMLNAMGYGAISLADVENLLIRTNTLIDNGPSHIEPVCGIYLLHGEGVDISDNRIVDNGAKNGKPMHTGKDGARAGINIVLAVPPTVPTLISRNTYPVQNGVPAAKIHDNIVSQPLGQALLLGALGPVSVVNNQFTSRGMILRSNPISKSFIAATVIIVNLGMSNELYGQLTNFSGLANSRSSVSFREADDAIVLPGLDDAKAGRYVANGNVLFSDNQCTLDLLETGIGFALSSIMILSLDDIGFHSNQCDCNLLDDFVYSQAILHGTSVRVSDNRFKEGIANALYSAMTAGLFNAATNNQSTHCLLILGFVAALRVDSGNGVLMNALDKDYCKRSQIKLVNAGYKRGKFL